VAAKVKAPRHHQQHQRIRPVGTGQGVGRLTEVAQGLFKGADSRTHDVLAAGCDLHQGGVDGRADASALAEKIDEGNRHAVTPGREW